MATYERVNKTTGGDFTPLAAHPAILQLQKSRSALGFRLKILSTSQGAQARAA